MKILLSIVLSLLLFSCSKDSVPRETKDTPRYMVIIGLDKDSVETESQVILIPKK